MSIELHCPQCQKLIRAPDTAGGRRGKCPYCGNSVYVPMPPDEADMIGLAPVDEEEERRKAELRREVTNVTAAMDHVTDPIPDTGEDNPVGDGPPVVVDDESETDIDAEVEAFVLAMGESRLDDAETATERLREAGPKARKHVQQLMKDQSTLILPDLPPPVVKGFLKTLLGRLS
jgi:hypothetical protein